MTAPTRLRCAATHDWPSARRLAHALAMPLASVPALVPESVGSVLAEPLLALTDLPAFRTSAMDGWVVRGPGPWTLLTGAHLAGSLQGTLPVGAARVIATGAALPDEADGVLRSGTREWVGCA